MTISCGDMYGLKIIGLHLGINGNCIQKHDFVIPSLFRFLQ